VYTDQGNQPNVRSLFVNIVAVANLQASQLKSLDYAEEKLAGAQTIQPVTL
jgi:hypothetical protein